MCGFIRFTGSPVKNQFRGNPIFIKFWRQLLALSLFKKIPFHENLFPHQDNKISIEIRESGVFLNYIVWGRESAVDLLIETGDWEENKNIFDRLRTQKQQIEICAGNPLQWDRLDEQRISRIRYTIPGGIKDKQNWRKLHEELTMMMGRFTSTFPPFVAKKNHLPKNILIVNNQGYIDRSFFHIPLKKVYDTSSEYDERLNK